MVGLQSLMPGQAPQGQMPGMPPGMMPQQPAPQTRPGVQALVPSLMGMGMDQLLMMFNDPNSPVPKNRVLAAMAEQQKEMAAKKAVAGQMAMAQAQQQPGTVKDQVVQGAMQGAAQGGTPGYAGGGIVALQNGGAVQKFSDGPNPAGVQSSPASRYLSSLYDELRGDPEAAQLQQQIRNKFAFASAPAGVFKTQSDQEREEAKDIMRRLPSMSKEEMRNILKVGPRATYEADMARLMSPYQSTGRDQPNTPVATPPAPAPAAPQSSATAFDITSPQSINALRIAAQDTNLPEAERADLRRRIAMIESQRPTGVAALPTKPSATLTPEEEQNFANRASALRTRQGLPEDVLIGRQGIASLAAENLAAQRAEREQFSREATERRDAALAKSQRGIFDDPMSLLALAGSIDTRKGRGFGSLAQGAAGLMGKREEQAEAARKEYMQAQQTERMLQANERQANMLEEQRKQAIRENDLARVTKIEDDLAALDAQKSQLLRTRQEHAEKMYLEGIKANAAMLQAGKLSELELAMLKPEQYRQVLEERAKASQLKKSPEELRRDTLERYADNWERLDILQKQQLEKQGIKNFQDYTRMRDQMARGDGGADPVVGGAVDRNNPLLK